MCSIKELRTTTTLIFNSPIDAITKILFSLPLVPKLHSSCTSFLNFLIRISLFDTPSLLLSLSSTVINSTLQPISSEIDSCCYGSDCVTKRNSCQLKFSGFDCVIKRKSCQFQPPLCEFVFVFSFLLSVPTADVPYVLVFLQCFPAIPASKNTLVLPAWINFKVGTPTKHNTNPTSPHFDTNQLFQTFQYITTIKLFQSKFKGSKYFTPIFI